jgi:hypothetical protein
MAIGAGNFALRDFCEQRRDSATRDVCADVEELLSSDMVKLHHPGRVANSAVFARHVLQTPDQLSLTLRGQTVTYPRLGQVILAITFVMPANIGALTDQAPAMPAILPTAIDWELLQTLG